jgi:hypothetical protein
MEHQTGPDGHGEADATSAAAAGLTAPDPEAGRTVPAEPVPADPVRAEPVRAEPVRAEPVRADPVRAEPVPAEPVQAELVPPTGELRVDAALKLLDRLPGLPVSEHSDLFEQVHAQLSEVLGELDSGPAGA